MKRLFTISFCLISFITFSQDEDIVKVIDDLTIKWDKQAAALEKYSGMKYYCTSDIYREKTIGLLDKIHHYDTVLYNIVNEKYKDVVLRLENEWELKNWLLFIMID